MQTPGTVKYNPPYLGDISSEKNKKEEWRKKKTKGMDRKNKYKEWKSIALAKAL